MPAFTELAKTEIKIFKSLSKEGKFSQVGQINGEVEDYDESKVNKVHE